MILWVKRKGRKRNGALDHAIGHGWVKAKASKYAHALAQGARVTPVIVETSGAISPRSLRAVPNGRAASTPATALCTGRSRTSARSFYIHHTQRLSLAAACGDVSGIFESLRGQKQRTAAMRGLHGGLDAEAARRRLESRALAAPRHMTRSGPCEACPNSVWTPDSPGVFTFIALAP